jgi:hypothetical protein
MPDHEILITLPTKPLKNADTRIAIKSDKVKLGELHVSQGTIDWKPAGKQTAKKISWERLVEWLNREWQRR